MENRRIEALIFDLGQVLARIDQERTMNGLCCFIDKKKLDKQAVGRFSKTVFLYETGQLKSRDFLAALSGFLHEQNPALPAGFPRENTLEDIWNAMIVEIPEENLLLLEKLKEHYRLYLLSNTNELHMAYVNRILPEGAPEFSAYFTRIFCSHELKLHKPDVEIYRKVCSQAGIEPGQSLFIDDRAENVEGAREAGLNAYRLTDFHIEKLFTGQGLLKPQVLACL